MTTTVMDPSHFLSVSNGCPRAPKVFPEPTKGSLFTTISGNFDSTLRLVICILVVKEQQKFLLIFFSASSHKSFIDGNKNFMLEVFHTFTVQKQNKSFWHIVSITDSVITQLLDSMVYGRLGVTWHFAI